MAHAIVTQVRIFFSTTQANVKLVLREYPCSAPTGSVVFCRVLDVYALVTGGRGTALSSGVHRWHIYEEMNVQCAPQVCHHSPQHTCVRAERDLGLR
jgi:hypothetical protein